MSARNLAAIDAANLGLEFIEHCTLPLLSAIAHLPCDNPDVARLCQLLQQQAQEYQGWLTDFRDQADA